MSITSSPYQKAAQPSVVISASSQHQQIGAIQGSLTAALSNGSGGLTINNGPFGRTPSNVDAIASLRTEHLKNDVFELSVERMVDLWLARFGHDWVDINELVDDSFWSFVYVRLKALSKVEVHYLTDRAHYVCRKPE